MILKVTDLEFSYNSHPVLENVSFQLEKGRILGVLGVNGAGKSTLLKCLNRVFKPRKGAVYINGRALAAMNRNEIARTVGYVAQKQGEEPFSVFDALLIGRKPHMGLNAQERDYRVVERVIGMLGLDHLALRPLCNLSGGEAQKVMLGRALVQEPEILLLDEPTSNLDLKNQLEVMQQVRRAVSARNLSAVVSMHDINLALRFADHLMILKDGGIHALTDPEAVTSAVIRETYGIDVTMATVEGNRVVVPLGPVDPER